MNRKERREKKNDIKILENVVTIINQYLPLKEELNKLTDNRNQSYVKYELKVIIMVQLLGYISEHKSMRSMTNTFNTQRTIENICEILEISIDELPHYDTINDALAKIKLEEFREMIKNILYELIRNKMLDKYRIKNKYFQIIVDGTGLASFNHRHCKHCLKKVYKNEDGTIKEIKYSHYVLEAKLAVGNMVFSIDSEFVENENENVAKQDCELNAFKRMCVRIKKFFKRLPMIITGDSLYSCSTVANICKTNKWEYVLRFKKDRIATLGENLEGLEKIYDKENKSIKLETRFWNNVHSGNNSKYNPYREYNVIEFYEHKEDKTIEFIWITSFEITNKNVQELILVGRKRWKIENEGFNEQKNGTFDIEHLYSHDNNAMKIHYLIIQIAHIVRQLLENGIKIIEELKMTKKEVSVLIKEALTKHKIRCNQALKRIQLRFD